MKRSTFAVPAGGVGRGEDVAGAVASEHLSEGPTLAIGDGVVAHHRLRPFDAERGEVVDRPLEHRAGGVTALITVLLDVGVARVIVDHAVQVDVADPGPLAGAGRGAVPGHGVAGALEAGQAGDVDVQEGAGPRPLVAAVGLATRPMTTREAMAVQHLPDRRAGAAADPGQTTGTEVRLPPGPQDRRLLDRREPSRLAVGPRGAVEHPAP
jgi:hypothetical protein